MKKWILLSTLALLLIATNSLYGSICSKGKWYGSCSREAKQESCAALKDKSSDPSPYLLDETPGKSRVYNRSNSSVSTLVAGGGGRIILP